MKTQLLQHCCLHVVDSSSEPSRGGRGCRAPQICFGGSCGDDTFERSESHGAVDSCPRTVEGSPLIDQVLILSRPECGFCDVQLSRSYLRYSLRRGSTGLWQNRNMSEVGCYEFLVGSYGHAVGNNKVCPLRLSARQAHIRSSPEHRIEIGWRRMAMETSPFSRLHMQ
jgi:hypothetical protein